jgi:hypothetical protein
MSLPDALAKKLGIKPGQAVYLLDAPAASAELLRQACAPDVRLYDALPDTRCDIVLFWPASLVGLVQRFTALQARIVPHGAIWAVIPKKPFARARGIDLTWEALQAAGLQTDLVDNKIASLSGEEYATRFVIRKERRGAYG